MSKLKLLRKVIDKMKGQTIAGKKSIKNEK